MSAPGQSDRAGASLERPAEAESTAGVPTESSEIRELRRKRDLLDLITSHMCDGLSVIDRGFVIRDANDAFVRHYGGDRQAIIGRTCHEITHGSPLPCSGADHTCPVVAARLTGRVARVEHRHVGAGQGERIVEITAIPVPGEDQRPELVVEVAHDITDRRAAERETAERQRLEGALAVTGAACHHLNQPTQSLLLAVEQLTRKAGDAETVERLATAMRSDVERIAHVTRQLQHVARCITEPYYGERDILDLARSTDGQPSADRGGARASATAEPTANAETSRSSEVRRGDGEERTAQHGKDSTGAAR